MEQKIKGDLFKFHVHLVRDHKRAPSPPELDEDRRAAIKKLPAVDNYWDNLIKSVEEDHGPLDDELREEAKRLRESVQTCQELPVS